MRHFVRAVVLTIAISAVAIVSLRASGVWERLKDQQFENGEAKPTGWVARVYASTMRATSGWIYAPFARLLDLQPEDVLLDVACGSGAFLKKHASHVGKIAGLDHSEDLIDIALMDNRERVTAGTAEFVLGDVTALPWKDEQFSAVTCNCVDCFPTKEKQALNEMYRVLRPGGRAVVSEDRRETMQAVGFTRVATERILWGHITTGARE